MSQVTTAKRQIEVERKVLLSDSSKCGSFIDFLIDNKLENDGCESQLNHYYKGFFKSAFLLEMLHPQAKNVADLHKLSELLEGYYKLGFRTRQIAHEDSLEAQVLLIVKYSLNQESSENGTVRGELEIPMNCNLETIDRILEESGLEVQSKWSRLRSTYQYNDLTLSLDRNAGYGYMLEVEKLLPEDSSEEERFQAGFEIERFIKDELKFEVLDQERLERMFKFYSANWQEYYRTNKTFTIE